MEGTLVFSADVFLLMLFLITSVDLASQSGGGVGEVFPVIGHVQVSAQLLDVPDDAESGVVLSCSAAQVLHHLRDPCVVVGLVPGSGLDHDGNGGHGSGAVHGSNGQAIGKHADLKIRERERESYP